MALAITCSNIKCLLCCASHKRRIAAESPFPLARAVKSSSDSWWVMINRIYLFSQDRPHLQTGSEGAERRAARLQPLKVQVDRVREDRAAQFGEAVQGKISQVGNGGSRLKRLCGHHISPDAVGDKSRSCRSHVHATIGARVSRGLYDGCPRRMVGRHARGFI